MKKRKVVKLLAWLIALSMMAGSALSPISASAAKKPKLSKKSATLTVGKSVKLKLKNAKKKVKWSSSNKKVASVNAKGVVKALKGGSAKIIAKTAGKKYTCKITVKEKKNKDADSEEDEEEEDEEDSEEEDESTEEPSATKKTESTKKPSATKEAEITQSPDVNDGAENTKNPQETATQEPSTEEPSNTPVRTKKPLVSVTISPVTEQPGETPAPSSLATVTPNPSTTNSTSSTYTISINVNKDWSTWSNHGKQFRLTSDGGATFISDLTQVENGTYDIYEDESDTNVNVTVKGNDTSVTINYLTVTFMDGNDKLLSPEQQVVVMGGKADRPEITPGKTGYRFVDWVTYNGSSTVFDFENTAIINTTSIYASWEQDSSIAAYTAEYYFQNIENDDYPTVASKSDQLEGIVEAAVPSYGRSFDGFTALKQEEIITISGDGNTVVRYYYERNKYTLTWNTNGGTINDTDYTTGNVKYGTSIEAPENVTKSGYLFKGWNTTVADTMPAKELSYTAQWSVVATATPTVAPTATPTVKPTTTPTVKPTATPTVAPTATPTVKPTATPTVEPTATPTVKPTATPTVKPTTTPTVKPTATPTVKPTATPTVKPTTTPTIAPTPTKTPTYTVSIYVNKDWSTWSNHGKQFQLTADGGATFITDLTQVENGNYDIYEGETDTNINVTVNGYNTSCTINYFTVTFMDGNDKLSSPEQQVVVMGGNATRPETTPGKTGYSFVDWVTYNGSTSAFDFENTTINNATSIYASWKQNGSIASYTAEYYFQNIEDDGYPTVASESEQLEGLVESTVPSYGKDFAGFTALEQTETITISGDGNTVVKYYYERNKYTLTWNTNGGTINDTDYTTGSVKYGTTIKAPANVSKSGYLFKGWNTTVADTMPTNSLSYTAQWSVVATATPTVAPTATPTVKPTATPTVSPTATPTVKPTTTPTVAPTATPTVKPTITPTVAPTATPTVEPTPTKTPTYAVSIYVNKDWSTWSNHGKVFQLTADGGATFITDLTQVENGNYDIYEGESDTNVNVTVNGNNTSVTINYLTVTFMDGNDKLSSPVQQVVVMGGNATRPETVPGKTGYSFVDWVTYNGSSTAFDFENTTINNATSIYASWKQNSSKAAYTAEYYFQNIEDDGYPTVASESEQLEGLVESTVPSYGKDFAGFTALEQTETITISGDGNTVVKYYYERNKYTLTWNTDGGIINDTDYTTGSVKYGTTIKAPANVTKSGYLFKGWNTAVADTMPTNSLSYTAQWSVVATATPTVKPTATPTVAPTATPTVKPTATPTVAPTATPTVKPTATPTVAPTATPTVKPTATPTVAPTATPTVKPTTTPTVAPTATATATPTVKPTTTPTPVPTPTAVPTSAEYTINYYLENLNDDGYTLAEYGIGRGSTGADVKVTAKSIEGFSVNTKLSAKTQTITIAADGSSVVNFYYKRETYTVNWYLDGGTLLNEDFLQVSGNYGYDEDGDYYWLYEIKYGATVTAPELKKSGYQVAGWYDYYEIDDGVDPSKLTEYSSFIMTVDMDECELCPVWEEGGEVDPEEPEEPTEIIISDVALGMTVSELQAVLGTQIRKDVTPQGYDAYVFNPSETCEAYENYIIVYVDGDTVVGWATMSEHYSYGDIVSVGDSASSLSGFEVMDNYDYEAAYVYESSDAYIMAFVDHQGSNQVYAVQVYGKTDASGNAVELDNLMIAENIKSNYTSEIYQDMAYQMFEWVNAFRYSQGVTLVQYVNNTTAQNHSVYMAFKGEVVMESSDGTSWTERFETNYKVHTDLSSGEELNKAENLGAGSPDAFGFVTWWIDDTDSASADGTSKMRNNICKTQTNYNKYYICTGFAHNANMKHVTFATMDIFY